MSGKKKVYVETTVVSDATALPARDVGKAVPKEYPDDALHIAVAAVQRRYDEGLEEIWRINREIAAEYPTWDAYVAGILAFQEEERRRGVKFVSFPPKRPEHVMDHSQ